MSQPRYQIFVSSTFRDLQEERQAVLNAILKLNQFPAGMEIFPAANDTPWEMIERIIKDSDYYVLIIGGKYGSIDAESNLSYTEKEYHFAVSQNIPVLPFIHSEPGQIPRDKSEMKPEVQEKLDAFKQKVNKHHCNYWRTVDELGTNVLASLSMSFVMNPQKGWIKAGGTDKSELLERLAVLQQRYDNLIEENLKLKDLSLFLDIAQFSFGDDVINLNYKYESRINPNFVIQSTWNRLFSELADNLIAKCVENSVQKILANYVFQELKLNYDRKQLSQLLDAEVIKTSDFEISDDSFVAVRNQFLLFGLIDISEISYQRTSPLPNMSFTEVIWTWQLSNKGRKLYLSQKAIRRENIENSI
ncbi:MAG TPA: DUF4062 domain-containing protein [Pyrinomonadaceae bacterium]|jgi:hypothetical protein